MENKKGHVENYRGTEYLINYIPKLKVEIAVNDHEVKNIVNAIISAAKTGVTGDGKIFVSNLDEVIRIRTNERGEDAI